MIASAFTRVVAGGLVALAACGGAAPSSPRTRGAAPSDDFGLGGLTLPPFDCGERWKMPDDTRKANVRPVAPDDAELIRARQRAQETLATFRRALEERLPSFVFSVKVSLPTPRGVPEHIWVSGVVIEGQGFRGRLDNDPVDLPGRKAGDPVSFGAEQIEDWSILDQSTNPPTICGGFTSRVLLGR